MEVRVLVCAGRQDLKNEKMILRANLKRIDRTFCISGILSLLELSMFFLVCVTLFVSYLTNVPS